MSLKTNTLDAGLSFKLGKSVLDAGVDFQVSRACTLVCKLDRIQNHGPFPLNQAGIKQHPTNVSFPPNKKFLNSDSEPSKGRRDARSVKGAGRVSARNLGCCPGRDIRLSIP